MKQDIETPEDVKKLVRVFYDKLMSDENINHFFLSLDLEHHLPKIEEFWNTILLGTQTYKNNMMVAHQHLEFKKEDFNAWLRHFEASLKELFEGPKAEEALSRANVIAWTMRAKLLKET